MPAGEDDAITKTLRKTQRAIAQRAMTAREEETAAFNHEEARRSAAVAKVLATPISTKEHPKGPQHRVQELQALRTETLKRKATDGYDPKMQLQSIDHEIARLTRK